MGSTLDAFKAQQQAAEAVHARLVEVAALLSTLQPQIERLKLTGELKETLDAETKWLAEVENLVKDVRSFREAEYRRFRIGVLWRWAMACLFALAAVGVAESVRVWAEQPYAQELEQLRSQVAFAEVVQHRILTMTPSERQQFERLMKLEPKGTR
jgi:hypothetical protein